MAVNADETKSRLLALAPELRNRVYRHALVQPRWIRVQADGPLPTEPGLLRVCRQIRTEAKAIYLQENMFCFEMPGFDSTNYIRFSSLSRAHFKATTSFNNPNMLQPPQNWRNLLAWLKAYQNRGVRYGPACQPDSPADLQIASGLFDVAEYARKKLRLSWEQIQPLLESSRGLAAIGNPAWAI